MKYSIFSFLMVFGLYLFSLLMNGRNWFTDMALRNRKGIKIKFAHFVTNNKIVNMYSIIVQPYCRFNIAQQKDS